MADIPIQSFHTVYSLDDVCTILKLQAASALNLTEEQISAVRVEVSFTKDGKQRFAVDYYWGPSID